MFGKPEASQQWSVHAELTISHQPNETTTTPIPTTIADQDGSGMRMVYTWTTHPSNETITSSVPFASASNASEHASRATNASEHASRAPNTSYGFQRGNMVFTSNPPRRPYNIFEPNRLGVNVQDSGYSSEHLLSPNNSSVYAQSSLPRRPPVPYNRRCRSTCSIILSTDFNTDGHNITCDTAVTQPSHHQCGRTQSLRCQTPTIKPDKRDSFYGCGDPWCYHAEEANRRCSPVLESCEECSLSNQSLSSRKPSRANTFSTHFCTKVPERNRSSPPNFRSKDMTTQTVETREKCTSPFEKILNSENKSDSEMSKTRKKKDRRRSVRRRSSNSSKRDSDPISNKNASSTLLSPDSADNKKSSKRITRSPAMLRGRSPLLERKTSSTEDSKKKQRTVHIDVYCTGSEGDSDSSSDVSEEEMNSSPQTVFESEKARMTHRKAGNSELPYSIMNFIKNNIPSAINDQKKASNTSKKESENSEEEQSSAYPSAMSSYSAIRDFESSMSSVPASWSALSASSCTIPDGYDSIAATSCKDTVSDFESLIQRKLSLAPTESDYFIPRKLAIEKNSSEISKDINKEKSNSSIPGSDSFEYADFTDRERIQKMEQMWGGNPDTKTWKSPQSERKHLLQQQKIQEYLDKRLKEKSEKKKMSNETESESTEDDSEQGWTFVRSEDGKTSSNLKRDTTVRKASKDAEELLKIESRDLKEPAKQLNNTTKNEIETKKRENTKPFVMKTKQVPNVPIIKSPFKSNFRSPFTIVPGIYSDPLSKAKKFGTIIGAMRKPGHHIGPAKNPDCLCEHCKRHYAESNFRNRTRSMGDPSTDENLNWRHILKATPAGEEMLNYSDF